jgi:hypothetical protein
MRTQPCRLNAPERVTQVLPQPEDLVDLAADINLSDGRGRE